MHQQIVSLDERTGPRGGKYLSAKVYNTFDSVADLVSVHEKLSDDLMALNAQENAPFFNSPNRCEKWFGLPTEAEVGSAFARGWPEGADQMREKLGQIENSPASHHPTQKALGRQRGFVRYSPCLLWSR